MAFPTTALPVKAELQLAGTWTDVTQYTYLRDLIHIVRGRRDEASRFEPSECALTFNNRLGRFSPRNPTGPYYGQLTRNTPIRVSVGNVDATLLRIVAGTTDFASAPDSAGLSVTGDLDLRIDLRLRGTTGRVVRKISTGQGSYSLQLNSDYTVSLFWYTDGTNFLQSKSTAVLPVRRGRIAIRATLDVNNGASGNTVVFYTSDTIAGTWTQLGASVVTAGTTNVFDGTAPVTIGLDAAGIGIYAVEIRNGIGGTVVGSPTFSSQSVGTTSFADAQGNTWTLQGSASIDNRLYRFYGEVPSWPQAWDISERDVWTPVTAAGVLRRLGQGTAPLKSAMQRFVLRNTSTAYAYWPMDDETGSTSIASGLPNGAAMAILGSPDLASDSTFVSSNPLPTLVGAAFTGNVNPMPATGTVYAQMLLNVPAVGEANDGVVLRVFTTGTASRWDISYTASTDLLRIDAYDNFGVNLFGQTSSNPNGKPLSIRLSLVQNGANIDWSLALNGYVNPTPGLGTIANTLAGRTVGVGVLVQVNPTGTLTDSTVGHLTVFAVAPDGVAEINALRGWAGEAAGRRVERLCSEEGITFTPYGNLDDTEPMGAQTPAQLLDLLAQCEASDMGQLFESREFLGLAYRPRASRSLQAVTLALDYQNLSSLEPIEDDQRTRNDVTVTRQFGSSARSTVDVGPLSTQAPPNGVGRYDDEVELSLYADAQLPDQASWRVTAGTVDEPRYPVIHAQLGGTAFAASASLIDQALAVDHGDLITVTNPPVWLPPDRIDQITIGQAETLGVRTYSIDYVCEPITPAGNAGTYDGTSRWASGGVSVLGGTMTTTATSVTVATPSGPLWTTVDTPLDIVVAGERITVGAISGASSPQTFSSLTRSVNGVVKSHLAGESVEIYRPNRYAI